MRRVVLAFVSLSLACSPQKAPENPTGIEAQCTTRDQCKSGELCVDGRCTAVEEGVMPSVTLSPATATVKVGATLQLTAEANVEGTITLGCDPAAGSITPAGLYTASATPGTYTITASIAGVQTTSSITTTALDVPAGFSATATASSVALTWQAVAGATGYRVWRAPDEVSPATDVIDVTSTDYTDTNVTLTTRYVYRVQALSNAVAGPFSEPFPARVLSGHSIYLAVDAPTKEILVFDAAQNGQTSPWRRFNLPASTTAFALQASAMRNELYVLATGNRILTYARSAEAGAQPTRVLELPAASNTFAIDEVHGRFFVAHGDSVGVYDLTAAGPTAALATITNTIHEANGSVCVACDVAGLAFNPASSQLYALGDDSSTPALRVTVYDWNQTDDVASSLTNDEYDSNAPSYCLGAAGDSPIVFSTFEPTTPVEEYYAHRFKLTATNSATAVTPVVMGSANVHFRVTDVTRNPLDPSALLMLINYGDATSTPDAARIDVMNSSFSVVRTLDGGAAGWGSDVRAIAAD